MQARKRQSDARLPKSIASEWCIVYREQSGEWLRRYFMATSQADAERQVAHLSLRFRRGTLWLASRLEQRDKEALDHLETTEPRSREKASAYIRRQRRIAQSDAKPERMGPSKAAAARAHYWALKRAHAAGLRLWWIKKDLREQLEAFAKPAPFIGEIWGAEPRESGEKKPSHHRLAVRGNWRGDTSPGWENGIRAMEDAA